MAFYIILFLCLVVGVLIGLWLGALVVRQRDPDAYFIPAEERRHIREADQKRQKTHRQKEPARGSWSETEADNGDRVQEEDGTVFVSETKLHELFTEEETGSEAPKKRKRKRRPKSKPASSEQAQESDTGVLAKKLSKREVESMVDFNCAADGIDKKQFVKDRQKQEDKTSFAVLNQPTRQAKEDDGNERKRKQ